VKAARPDPPRHLGVAGRRTWRAALAALDADVQFTDRDLDLLRSLCGQSDLVARLEQELAAAPSLLVDGASGQPREHPHVAALSRARLAHAKLWSEIRLEVAAAGAPPVRSRRAQRAAEARWRVRRELAETRRELTG
jgi:phage terminase small subunit